MARAVDHFFDDLATRYDDFAQRGIPRYDEMLDELMHYLPEQATAVLELGCGTGALTLGVARRYRQARLTAVDGSTEMIDVARGRLAGDPAAVEFVVALFEELDLQPAAYDLIVSNMSLHHVADKRPFYTCLREALRPEGLLVFGDELIGASPAIEQLHWNRWEAFAGQPGHLTDAERAKGAAHARQFDHYETLPRQLELLQEAGFAPVDCVWRYLNYSIWVARPA
jgi:tRNA (cmo5U34)-methyltransferase